MDHRSRTVVLLLVLSAACGATGSYLRSAPPPLPLPERYGSVESIRETVRCTGDGSPAVAGLGTTIAMTGNDPAQDDSSEKRTYHVAVRFSDGSQQVFDYFGRSPFAVGDQVAMTPAGLRRVGASPGPLEGPGPSLPLP